MSDKQHNCPDCTHVETCSEVGAYRGMPHRCTLPAKHLGIHTVCLDNGRVLSWGRVLDETSYTLHWRIPDSLHNRCTGCLRLEAWNKVTPGMHCAACEQQCHDVFASGDYRFVCQKTRGHTGLHQSVTAPLNWT